MMLTGCMYFILIDQNHPGFLLPVGEGGNKHSACPSLQVTDGVSVPASVALPFGAFERTLQDPSNAASADAVQGLQKDLVSAALGSSIRRCPR